MECFRNAHYPDTLLKEFSNAHYPGTLLKEFSNAHYPGTLLKEFSKIKSKKIQYEYILWTTYLQNRTETLYYSNQDHSESFYIQNFVSNTDKSACFLIIQRRCFISKT